LHVVRFQYSGAASGQFDASGPGSIPTDYSRDFATLADGSAFGVPIPFQPLAVNAGSLHAASGFDMFLMFLNPSITGKGTYTSANCPETGAFTGCFWNNVRFGVPAGGGSEAFSLMPVRDSVSLTVHKMVADTLHATFGGTYALVRPGQPDQRVQVAQGLIVVVRNVR
jgi:hypothetical protein